MPGTHKDERAIGGSMSSYGILQAQLIAQQKEAERRRRVQQQCMALAQAVEQKIQVLLSDPGLTTFLGGISALQEQAASARSLAAAKPDDALKQLQVVAGSVQELVTSAHSKRECWSEEREQIHRQASLLLDRLRSITLESPACRKKMEELVHHLEQASTTAMKSSDFHSLIQDVEETAQAIASLDEQESVRKLTVRHIVDLLSTRGFVVGQPKIRDDIVHLQAKMPSGKGVLLQIFSDAKIHFDFENYEGTACKDELDAILTKLETEGQIETCVEQFVWHNPDKIKKGSKDLPYGQTQKRYMM